MKSNIKKADILRGGVSQQMQPLLSAHRGASKEAPENTLAAIKQAILLNANYVEIDVRLSKEGIPIVLHDPSTTRMSGHHHPSADQLTVAEIQQIDVGQKFGPLFVGEKVPTLWDVLQLDWKGAGLMIEIKKCPQDPKKVVTAVFDVLKQTTNASLPPLVIGSFCAKIVAEVQRHLQEWQQDAIGVLGIAEKLECVDPFIQLNIKHLALWYPLITPSLMASLQEKGMTIWTFTVDDVKKAEFLLSLGVDGIISNDTRLMKEKIFHE
jgi:glycerophosphoryl diester phosphodiesterase